MNYFINSNNQNLSIFIWLISLSIMVFTIILIGGLTRLTNSGLSMVDWKPIMGSIPPLTNENWLNMFNAYKNTPEFKIVNKNMTLIDFKYIFWWEWSHRFFARCIGIVLIFPMLYFFIKKKIPKKLLKNLLFLLVLIFIQSIVGWWMVKSGLYDNPYVSPYRLAFHLGNAIIILSILVWSSLNYWTNLNLRYFPNNNFEILFFLILFLLFITIITGAFMAGTHAGKSFNSFPLMNGYFIPEDYFIQDYGFRNFFENTVAINFNHRWLASLTFILIIMLSFYIKISKKFLKQNYLILLVSFFATLQFLLGIFTLISNVNISLASMHQVNSVLLLTSLLLTYHSIKKKGF